MTQDDWGPEEPLSGGKYLKYNSRTKRWYLYNSRHVMITSNRNKQKLINWRESE